MLNESNILSVASGNLRMLTLRHSVAFHKIIGENNTTWAATGKVKMQRGVFISQCNAGSPHAVSAAE